MSSQLRQRRLYGLDNAVSLISSLEPFDNGLFSHVSDSAFPPDRSQPVCPSITSLVWSDASLDDTMVFALRSFADSIRSVALKDGQNVSHAAKYPELRTF
jgi:hypothetical protein